MKSRSILILIAWGTLVSSCGRTENREWAETALKRVGPLNRAVFQWNSQEDGTLTYRFDDLPESHGPRNGGNFKLEFGEMAPDPSARLLLHLNEGSGESANSVVPESAGISLVGGQWGPGRFGSGLAFDGKSGGLQVSWNGDHQGVQRGLTLSLWIKQPRDRNENAVDSNILTVPGILNWVLNRNGRSSLRLLPEVQTDPSEPLVSEHQVVRGRWSHLAVTIDPPPRSWAHLYIDGVPTGRTELTRDFTDRVWPGIWSWFQPANASVKSPVQVDEISVVDRTLSSREIEEIAKPEPEYGPHRLTLHQAGREAVFEFVVFKPVSPPELYRSDQWSNGVLEQVAVDGSGVQWSPVSWKQLSPRPSPRGRTCHALRYIGNGSFLVFGGEVRDPLEGLPWENGRDTWLFENGQWTNLQTVASPPPRCHSPVACAESSGLVLMFGGWFNPKQPYGDTWLFRTDDRRWEHVNSKPSPSAVNAIAPGLAYSETAGKFILFKDPETWSFDPKGNRWEMLEPEGRPSRRISPMMEADGKTGSILLFGGQVREGQRDRFLNDTWIYEPEANRWRKLNTASSPQPRVRGGFAYDARKERFVLYGGVREADSKRFQDLWIFDPDDRDWRVVNAQNPPGRRGGYYGMGYDHDQDQFLLFGGRASFAQWLDDTWSFSFREDQPGKMVHVLQIPNENIMWYVQGSFPKGTSWKASFRTSSDGWNWSDPESDPTKIELKGTLYVEQTIEIFTSDEWVAPRIDRAGFLPRALYRGARIMVGPQGPRSFVTAPRAGFEHAPLLVTSESDVEIRIDRWGPQGIDGSISGTSPAVVLETSAGYLKNVVLELAEKKVEADSDGRFRFSQKGTRNFRILPKRGR